jgi:antitoxin (DNA-binding transcriptional repressor) of toxin-antitoxin stability system
MKFIPMTEARKKITDLAHLVAMGEEFTVTKEGEPVLKLSRPDKSNIRMLGVDDGRFDIPDSFNDPIDWAAPQDSNR